MPGPTPTLGIDDAVDQLRRCLASDGGDVLGVEIEWLVVDVEHPARSVSATEVLDAASGDPLRHGGRITVEPGGQLELSASAHSDPTTVWRTTSNDADELRTRMEAAGFSLVAMGLDPVRSAPRTVDELRYQVIQASFDRAGPSAMCMATNSAGLQLNVDLGPDPLWTWRLADWIGPAMLAMFANSPMMNGMPTGWASTRQLLWQTVPDRRSVPVPTWSIDAWVDHALDLPLLFIRDGDTGVVPDRPLTFRQWIVEGHVVGHPTTEDLAHHLTTIFPPVRPRGWLELRMMDSVPDDGVAAAVAIGATVLRDRALGTIAREACRQVRGRWHDAARDGCADASFADAASALLALAAEAVTDDDLSARCSDWSDRYPARRRSPADDRLDERRDLSRP